MSDTIRPTRFAELGYRQDAPGLWRIYDITDASRPAAVGPQYRSKAELLADLERYAALFGCGAAQPKTDTERQILNFLAERHTEAMTVPHEARGSIVLNWDALAGPGWDTETTFGDLVRRMVERRGS